MFNEYDIDVYLGRSTDEIKNFVKQNHYLKSVSRGNEYVFTLKVGGVLMGVAMFGCPVGCSVNKKYGKGGKVLELKRFVLKNTPKNTASWFMGKCMNWLKTYTKISSVISYADPSAGHEGTIYKASNFEYLGTQNKNYVGYIFKVGSKIIHQRAAYQKGTKTYHLVKQAKNNGSLKKVRMQPKHIFLYKLHNESIQKTV